MRINQLEIADTRLGKFVGCALMGVREHLAEMDLQDLDVRVTVDGHEVDIRQVFSAWEELTGKYEAVPGEPRGTRSAGSGSVVRVQAQQLRDLSTRIDHVMDRLSVVDTEVSASYDNIVNEIERRVRNDIQDLLREAVRDHSVGDPCDDVRDDLSDIMSAIADLATQDDDAEYDDD